MAHEVSFLDLIQGEKQFQVPLYQRTYSWAAQMGRDRVYESMADLTAGLQILPPLFLIFNRRLRVGYPQVTAQHVDADLTVSFPVISQL